MIDRLLNLKYGELKRLFPFFSLYLLLFGALTLADGFTLALFVQHVGRDSLPMAYGCIGVANFALVAWYFFRGDAASSTHVFVLIVGAAIAVFVLSWLGIGLLAENGFFFGLLFVSREIALTMVLLHFGSYLQDFFTRAEMNRVLPLIYSGGRVGGILGAELLQDLSPVVGVVNLALVAAGMLLAGLVLLSLVRRTQKPLTPEQEKSAESVGESSDELAARTTLGGFLRFIWTSPLLFWLTFTSILFVVSRWLLNFEYTAYFCQHFGTDAQGTLEMVQFLGDYTRKALLISLILQVFVVNRLIQWFGLSATQIVYSALLAGALVINLFPMSLGLAIFARFVETELRFGLRNPIMQLITNRFSKELRTRVRSWTMGVLNPVATLLASGLLSGVVGWHSLSWLPWVGTGVALAYLLGSIVLSMRLEEKSRRIPILAQVLPTQFTSSRRDARAA